MISIATTVYVTSSVGCPTVLRADQGTENGNIAFSQLFLIADGGDSFAGKELYVWTLYF